MPPSPNMNVPGPAHYNPNSQPIYESSIKSSIGHEERKWQQGSKFIECPGPGQYSSQKILTRNPNYT